MTTLVAIPYFGVPEEIIDKAVRHALAQTADVVVLVAGDGQKPPITFRHDRLVVGTFPTNLGAPATQQAMIEGSPFEWYAPHGADDWTEPDHVASLLALRSPAAGSQFVWFHQGKSKVRLQSRRTWIEFGAFRTSLLRDLGGYNPAERCGQDSVLISILVHSERVPLTQRPTYHKLHRDDSLTHHPDTKHGSPFREAVKVRNRVVLAECERLGWRHRGAIRAYRESLVTPALRSELDDRAALVSKWLS